MKNNAIKHRLHKIYMHSFNNVRSKRFLIEFFFLLLILYAFKIALKFVHCTDMSGNRWDRSFYVCEIASETIRVLGAYSRTVSPWSRSRCCSVVDRTLQVGNVPQRRSSLTFWTNSDLFDSWSLIFNCNNCISYS